MIIGYARVSTREQDLSNQLAELGGAGCAKVYSEKASGARGDRAELRKVIDRLQSDDVLVVTRLGRLARSTRDLLNVLESVKQAGAGFRSLKDAWADTTTPHGQLMLTILGGLAERRRLRGGPTSWTRPAARLWPSPGSAGSHGIGSRSRPTAGSGSAVSSPVPSRRQRPAPRP
jgi:hypothetical protein